MCAVIQMMKSVRLQKLNSRSLKRTAMYVFMLLKRVPVSLAYPWLRALSFAHCMPPYHVISPVVYFQPSFVNALVGEAADSSAPPQTRALAAILLKNSAFASEDVCADCGLPIITLAGAICYSAAWARCRAALPVSLTLPPPWLGQPSHSKSNCAQ